MYTYNFSDGIIPAAYFSARTDIVRADICNGITRIEGEAFRGCTNLTSVNIPNSVTHIGTLAFYDTSLTSVTIPPSVTYIASFTFCLCESLTSVTIPSGVTLISDNAFQLCTSLQSIDIPNSVTSITEFAFSYTALTSVTIPDSVTKIEAYTFRGCPSLTSITIPSGVTSIDAAAFQNCSGLTSITCYATTAPSLSNYAFDGIASSGTLRVPTGSNYSSWLSALPSGWTITYI